jgi:hypothetical protein
MDIKPAIKLIIKVHMKFQPSEKMRWEHIHLMLNEKLVSLVLDMA